MRQCVQVWTKLNLQKTAFETFQVIWFVQTDHITFNFLIEITPYLDTFHAVNLQLRLT